MVLPEKPTFYSGMSIAVSPLSIESGVGWVLLCWLLPAHNAWLLMIIAGLLRWRGGGGSKSSKNGRKTRKSSKNAVFEKCRFGVVFGPKCVKKGIAAYPLFGARKVNQPLIRGGGVAGYRQLTNWPLRPQQRRTLPTPPIRSTVKLRFINLSLFLLLFAHCLFINFLFLPGPMKHHL